MQKFIWFACGLSVGFTALSITRASVPTRGLVTDDTAIYQRLSEIQVKKQAKLDFDSDITRLSQSENHFRENLPDPRLKGPLQRISQQKYRYVGSASRLAHP